MCDGILTLCVCVCCEQSWGKRSFHSLFRTMNNVFDDGEHRWDWDDGLDIYDRCVECSIWCEECDHEAEAVDEFGHCLRYCSQAAPCKNCGRMTEGWRYDDGLDDHDRCLDCSIQCEICLQAMRSTDDLDDQLNCEICAKLIKEKRKVSVNFGSRTIVVDVTLGDSIHSLAERIMEAHGQMTRDAKIYLCYFTGLHVSFFAALRAYKSPSRMDCPILQAIIPDLHSWRNSGTVDVPSVIELIVEP